MIAVLEERLDGPQSLDVSRFEALYREHCQAAIKVAYLITGDEALAQDLVHDAFVRIATRFIDLRKPESFGFYLQKTVTNLARSHYRRLKRERAYVETNTPPEEAGALSHVEDRETIWGALQILPERQRTALVLRYYLDLSDQDAASFLGCRQSTVRSLIFRGLQALRPEVEHE